MFNKKFINDISHKHGFTIKFITALTKDEDGKVIHSKNLYKHNNSFDGFNAGKKYVAVNLLKNDIDINFISIVTNFPLNYIKKLKQSLK